MFLNKNLLKMEPVRFIGPVKGSSNIAQIKYNFLIVCFYALLNLELMQATDDVTF